MAFTLRAFAVLFVGLQIVACGRARLVDDPLPDSGVDAALDAPTVDMAVRDRSVTLDTGVDAPSTSDPALLRALTCGLDEEGALLAAVRFASCSDAGQVGLANAALVYQNWQAFGWGQSTVDAPFPVPSCPYWQCVAEADSCERFRECENINTCDGTFAACTGNLLRFCRPSMFGPSIRGELDCAAFGGVCAGARCRGADGCSFGTAGEPILRPEGERLVSCGGASITCEMGPGVAGLGASLPWCGPDIDLAEARTECDGDALLFRDLLGEGVRFDCTAAGYAGCAGNACIE